MKKCSSCGEVKSLTLFQKRSASKDGLTASCKSCLKERDRIRDQTSERKLMKEMYVKGKGKEIANACKRRYIEKNSKVRRVHVITGNAIRNGVIKKKPCKYCGSVNVQAHHSDYDKPLDVTWLCPTHHQQWHDEYGEGKNKN